MSFADNSTLITSANKISIEANGVSGDTYTGTAGADTFVIADGNVGDDTITGFSHNDTLITGKKIYDGNGDGYIDFGPNNVLDVDRTSSKNAGNDQIAISGAGGDSIHTIRYLGTKDGGFAYGSAETRDFLLGHFGSGFDSSHGASGGVLAAFGYKYDSSVGDDTYNFSKGSSVLLVDNATGLNFGGDTINGFGTDDLLVTTSKVYDSDVNKIVTFGYNKVLDLSGAGGPSASDPAGGPGGEVSVPGYDGHKQGLVYLGELDRADGTHYYFYGAPKTTVDTSFLHSA